MQLTLLKLSEIYSPHILAALRKKMTKHGYNSGNGDQEYLQSLYTDDHQVLVYKVYEDSPCLPDALTIAFANAKHSDTVQGGVLPDGRRIHHIPIHSALWRESSCTGTSSLRLQFPVAPAYALTIHKAQGLTLNPVVIDLDFGSFHPPGGAYVALSRARALDGISLLAFNEDCFVAHSKALEWYHDIHHGAKCGNDSELDPSTLSPVDADGTPQGSHGAAARSDAAGVRRSTTTLPASRGPEHGFSSATVGSQLLPPSFSLSGTPLSSTSFGGSPSQAPVTKLANWYAVSCYVNTLCQALGSIPCIVEALQAPDAVARDPLWSALLRAIALGAPVPETVDGGSHLDPNSSRLDYKLFHSLPPPFYDAESAIQQQQDALEFCNYVVENVESIGALCSSTVLYNVHCELCEPTTTAASHPHQLSQVTTVLDLSSMVANIELNRTIHGQQRISVSVLLELMLTWPVEPGPGLFHCGRHRMTPRQPEYFRLGAPRVLLLRVPTLQFTDQHHSLPLHLNLDIDEVLPVRTAHGVQAEYELCAITLHIAQDHLSGHYVCLVKRAARWWYIDDLAPEHTTSYSSVASFCQSPRMMEGDQRPSLLFYTKRGE